MLPSLKVAVGRTKPHDVNHAKPARHRTCAAGAAWPGDGNQHLLVLGGFVIPTIILEALQAHTANTASDN